MILVWPPAFRPVRAFPGKPVFPFSHNVSFVCLGEILAAVFSHLDQRFGFGGGLLGLGPWFIGVWPVAKWNEFERICIMTDLF
ncbi:hypothetical protein CSC82_07695 [Rhodobacteraceae bacterium 4F10]|jgi:hypothetical protein|nr:hypothetical protein CSC82_07695 [Rhodobacteraceae bacterium 4F10]